MPAGLRLEADGLDPFPLTDETGFDVTVFDPGFPPPRASSSPRPDADGEDDSTTYVGARAVVLSGTVVPTATQTRSEVLDRLRAFTLPRRRPWLYFTAEDGGDERRIRLVPSEHSAPLERPGSAAVTVGWRGPDGFAESVDVTLESASATPDVEPGRTYPRTYFLTYPDATPVGAVVVTNPGTAPALPVLELYGPATDPVVANVTTGKVLAFEGIELASGDYLEIDTAEKTILLNGLESASRYGFVDFAVSEWWDLEPGDNLVRYYPAVFDEGAEARVRYRARWI